MTVKEITLPWPPKKLHSNSGADRWAKAHATKKARQTAWGCALRDGIKALKGDRFTLRLAYHPPDKRRRDAQNMPFALKAYIDGIADALGVDDGCFLVFYPPEFDHPVTFGEVVVKVEAMTNVPLVGTINGGEG